PGLPSASTSVIGAAWLAQRSVDCAVIYQQVSAGNLLGGFTARPAPLLPAPDSARPWPASPAGGNSTGVRAACRRPGQPGRRCWAPSPATVTSDRSGGSCLERLPAAVGWRGTSACGADARWSGPATS